MGAGGIRWFIFCALLLTPVSGSAEPEAQLQQKALFYHGQTYGSEASFNPASSFVNWTVDTLQVPKNFTEQGLHRSFDDTVDSLLHPDWAMRKEGGYTNFVKRQIVPLSGKLAESKEAVPNYFLHLFGGGMVYRKNVEWFEANGYTHPKLAAVTLVMTAEFLQEVIEKKSTPADDPVADFYLFRPAGILLFSWEPAARFAAETLHLVEWPHQPMISTRSGDFANVGENFAVRPALFGSDRTRPFVFFGLTTLAGLSHKLDETDSFSWGAGAAITSGVVNNVSVRPSYGAFYDRNDSQLWSLIVNGTDDLAVRLNIFPEVVRFGSWSPGFYLGIGDHGDYSVGVVVTMVPVGLAFDL